MNADKVLAGVRWAMALDDELSARDRRAAKRRHIPVSHDDELLIEQADTLLQRRRYGEPRSGGYFQKSTGSDDGDDGEPNAHAKAKADHHERLQRLYERVADMHAAMVDHYSSGAQGAHVSDDRGDMAAHAFEEGDETREADAAINALKVAAARADDAATALAFDVERRLGEAELMKRAVAGCLRQPRVGDPSATAFTRVLRRSR